MPYVPIFFQDDESDLNADYLTWIYNQEIWNPQPQGVNTLVVWQASVSPELLALAQSLDFQVFVSNDLSELVNDVWQAWGEMGGVLTNDASPDGSMLNSYLATPTSYGGITLGPDGAFSYTPNPGFYGMDTFTYYDTDPHATSNTMTDTIIVYSMPVAYPDSYTTSPGQQLNVSAANGVLANDTNADGNPLSAQLVNGPSNGQLILNNDGSFSYTPNPGFGGTDSFMYSAVNGPAVSTPTTVTITVYASPVANPDYYSVAENQTLTVGAWSNEAVAILSDSQADDGVLQNALVNAVPGVQILAQGLGSDLTAGILEMLGGPVNAMGINTIVAWQADIDPSLVALAQSLGFQMFVSDDLNTLINDVQQSPLNTLGGVLDNDIPNGPALTATLVTPPANGTLTFNPDGSFSYTPNTNFTGTDTFTYTASNGYLTSNMTMVTFTVYSPVLPIANPDAYQTAEGQRLFINAFNDMTIAVFSDTLADAAIMANALSGLGPNVQVVAENDASNYNADYINWLAGPGAYLGVNTLVVWQLPNEQPLVPIAQCLAMQIMPFDDLSSMVEMLQQMTTQPAGLLVNDVSPDGHPLSTQEVTPPANGSLMVLPNGAFDYHPNPGFWGTDTFTYHDFEAYDNTYSQPTTVTITVFSTPVANPDSYTTSPGQQLNVSAVNGVLVNDTNPDGNPLSAQLMNGTRNGNLQFNNDGSFSYTPNDGFAGTDSFMYCAVNGPAVSAPVTVTINVYTTPVANPDYYSVVENQTLTVGAWSVETVAILSDSPADDTTLGNALANAVPDVPVLAQGLGSDLTAGILEMLGGPDNAMGFNTIVVWQWDVDPSLVALAQSLGFQIFVSDDLTTLINDVQQSPLNTLGGVLDNDYAGGSPLSATLGTPPVNGTLAFNADGSFSYTPNPGFTGTDTFSYTASNGYLTSNQATVTITVYSTPMANSSWYSDIENQTLNVGTSMSEQIAIFSDSPADDAIVAEALAAGAPNANILCMGTANDLTTDNDQTAVEMAWLADQGINTLVVWQVQFIPYMQALAMRYNFQVFVADDLPTLVNDVQQQSNCMIGGVLATAVNADGLPLTAQLVTPTSNGSITLNSDGSFSYTPNDGFYGSDTFTYIATDGLGTSTPATVTIQVYSIPVAYPDACSAIQDGYIYIAPNGLLANDTNADGEMVATVLYAATPNGNIQLHGDGSFSYSPNFGFSGTDSFSYFDINGPAASEPTTVTITVYSIPVANPDQYGTFLEQTLNVTAANGVLANDTDADGEMLSATLLTPPANGTLTLNADGSFSYTPNPGFSGTDSFTYIASDAEATSEPATVTIMVYSIPVANPDYYSTPEGQTLTVGAWSDEAVVILSDSQADDTTLANALANVVPDVPVLAQGLGSDLSAGILEMLGGPDNAMGFNTIVVWQWDMDPSLVALAQALGFQIFVSDDLNTLINDVQQSPLNTPGGVLDNDTNADGNPLTATLVTPPANGTLTLNPDGSFTYTPNAGFLGTDTFTYTATDGYATSAPATVTIAVYSVPMVNAEMYSDIQDQTLHVGTSMSEQIAIFSDSPDDDVLLADALAAGAPDANILCMGTASDLTTDNDQTAVEMAWLADQGINTLVVWQVQFIPYMQALAMRYNFQVFVADDLPTLVNDVQQQSNCMIGGVLANAVNADGLPLTAQLVTPTSNGGITLNADGSFTYTPNAGFYGTDSFTYTAADGLGTSTPATVTIIVYSIPVANPDSFTVSEGSFLNVAPKWRARQRHQCRWQYAQLGVVHPDAQWQHPAPQLWCPQL